MSPSIWTRCAGSSELQRLVGTAHRVVESQTLVSTRRLVDSDAEHDVLEALVDRVKPANLTSRRFRGLHYLLSTPFRHPPLRHGSRFGGRTERGLFYGSLALSTAFAEVAYYRFLFLAHSAAAIAPVTTELTAFAIGFATDRGVDLTSAAFARFDRLIHSPSDYRASQPLGDAMRAAGVEAFVFRSARDPAGGKNVGLFEPVFVRKRPGAAEAYVCVAHANRVEVLRRDPLRPERTVFPRTAFELRGRLPDPGA